MRSAIMSLALLVTAPGALADHIIGYAQRMTVDVVIEATAVADLTGQSIWYVRPLTGNTSAVYHMCPGGEVWQPPLHVREARIRPGSDYVEQSRILIEVAHTRRVATVIIYRDPSMRACVWTDVMHTPSGAQPGD